MLHMPDALDASQQSVVDAVVDAVLAVHKQNNGTHGARGGIAVLGAPGSGKTVTAIAAAAACWQVRSESAILLTPQRRSAALIKPTMAEHLPEAYLGTPVRTPASLAFDVVRQSALLRGESAPRLLTGAEQDRMLAEIIAERSRLGDDTWPSHIDAETRSLAGFRDEVRDFIATVTALRLTPEQVGELQSDRWGNTWRPLSDLYAEYVNVKNSVYGVAFDVNELMLQSSWELAHSSAAQPFLDTLSCLIVDDAQEATIGLPGLLAPFVEAGVSLVTLGDPDASVGRFQGAQPVFASRLHDAVGYPARAQYILSTEYRYGGAIAALAGDLVNTIGVVAGVEHRHPASIDDPANDGIVGSVSVAANELSRSLANELREQHYLHDVPWKELAIIARSQGMVQQLEADLGALGIPTRGVGAIVPRHESASSVLLDAAAWACDVVSTGDVLESLATSYLGNLSGIDLRRLMRWLRIAELREGGTATGRELLIAWIDNGTSSLDPSQRLVQRFQRFVDTLRSARDRVDQGSTVEEVLWGLWDRARVATTWQHIALEKGVEASIAHHNLDAVLALFQSAQRYVEQSPDRPSAEWIRRMLDQPLPEDVIGASETSERITIATPSSVQGASFDVVVLTGLSTGVWPNLRLRDSLLGASALAALVVPDQVAGSSRHDVLHDELRLLYYAVTRAKRHLLLFDVQSIDSEPSAFADVIKSFANASNSSASAALGHGEGTSGNGIGATSGAVRSVVHGVVHGAVVHGVVRSPATTQAHAPERAPLPASLAAFTGEQRRRLLTSLRSGNDSGSDSSGSSGRVSVSVSVSVSGSGHDDDSTARESAQLLRQLMTANVPGASPNDWHGMQALSTPHPRKTNISVSPSSLERFETCQLAWVIDQLGGNRSMVATNFGTLLHHALEQFARAGVPLDQTVHEGWSQLVFEAPYADAREQDQAKTMIDHLNEYLHQHENDRVASEIGFEFKVNDVPVRGFIDRIERSPEGVVRVVDLKTGTHAPTIKEAETNAQLGCYQLALRYAEGLGGDEGMHSIVESMDIANSMKGDPILLYVRTTNLQAKIRKQTVFDDGSATAMETRITDAAEHMGDPIVEAAVDTHCSEERFGKRCMMLLTSAVSE